MEWLLRGIGTFYAVSGLLVVHALALDGVADKLLAALEGAMPAKERTRRLLLRVGAALTISGGLALLLLSRWTLPLMLANVAAQGGWLAYARVHFAPEDADQALGRKRTINAFILYCAVTALVVWAFSTGIVVAEAGTYSDALPPVGGILVLAWLLRN